MAGTAALERRLVRNVALAAGVAGALIGLAGCVFATFIGHPPSAPVLAAVTAGLGLVLAGGSRLLVARVAAVRRALGLAGHG